MPLNDQVRWYPDPDIPEDRLLLVIPEEDKPLMTQFPNVVKRKPVIDSSLSPDWKDNEADVSGN